MNIKEYFHRNADLILKYPVLSEVYKEVKLISENCPIPYYEGKSTRQKNICVVQQIMNTYFDLMFEKSNWELQPQASNPEFDDNLKADFRKSFNFENRQIIAQIEVELGNAASFYRDYFKFQLSYFDKQTSIDLGIFIVPCSNMSQLIDSGIGSFEKVIRELPSANDTMTVPTYVIGLNFDEENVWNLKNEARYIDEFGVDEYLKILKSTAKLPHERKVNHNRIVENYINENIAYE